MPATRLLAAALLWPALVAGQDPEPAPPTFEQEVDRLFRGCERPGSPGAVVLVAAGDEVLLEKAWGLADLERSVPLSVDSVLDIGSTSKQFTAACVLLLQQDEKLALDDPIRRHVDELPACCEPVTLRHLMLHTSGVPDYIGLMTAGGADVEDRTTNDDALDALAKVDALAFDPGTRWAYSNSNYLLLSLVVGRVSGRPLPAFAQERIFGPLGMASTHVHEQCTDLVPNRALSYSKSARGGWRWNFSNWEQTGDGAVFTTVGDLLKWSRNFAHGPVGGEALRAAMARPGALDGGEPLDYGCGLVFDELDGTPIVSHGGAWAAYRAELLRVPAEELTVVCLCNRDDLNPSQLARRIARLARAR